MSYVFKVAESLDSFNAQVAGFRGQLFGWFAAIAATMLLAFSLLLRGLMKPLRKIEAEIGESALDCGVMRTTSIRVMRFRSSLGW